MTGVVGLMLAALTLAAPKSMHITSRSADLDHREGVVMFEGDVKVTYSDGSVMCADRLFMFASGTNELSRVVAVGHVAITNGLRTGSCAMAVYRRRKGEVEMFSDGTNVLARLEDMSKGTNVLSGVRIRFWPDSEQVEVMGAQIDVGVKAAEKELK